MANKQITDIPIASAVSPSDNLIVIDGTSPARKALSDFIPTDQEKTDDLSVEQMLINKLGNHGNVARISLGGYYGAYIGEYMPTYRNDTCFECNFDANINALAYMDGVGGFDNYSDAMDVVTYIKSLENRLVSLELTDHPNDWYGIEWEVGSIVEPNRIGSAILHNTLPIQKQMRRCLLADDGTVTAYLSDGFSTLLEDGSPADLSGASGQVMVELPQMWVRFEEDGDKRRAMMSDKALPGFHKWDKCYVSAYEATVQRSTQKLSSVVNMDADYRGGNNNASLDNTPQDQRGKPATFINLNNFRKFAKNRGERWNCYTYQIHKRIFWLCAVEFCTFELQGSGALGSGATSLDTNKWFAFNSMYPFLPCGITNDCGNGIGRHRYTMPNAYDLNSTHIDAISYRGIENPFGHISKLTDGVYLRVYPSGQISGQLIQRSMAYICDDVFRFADDITGDYTFVGDLTRSDGYVRDMLFGDDGDILPISVGNGEDSLSCNYYQSSIPSGSEAKVRAFYWGGYGSRGASAGFLEANTQTSPTNGDAAKGTRLCYI